MLCVIGSRCVLVEPIGYPGCRQAKCIPQDCPTIKYCPFGERLVLKETECNYPPCCPCPTCVGPYINPGGPMIPAEGSGSK
ncbi:hypothetical protein RB195_013724 [Necator americanus]|uniref:Uncharacterized protein n=2 Tax=Necator americanus TaxID=51031 RepID=A0ABR1DY35_NECAM|nr:hypothetical protein NECAME_19188 [Necator americanus]ETN71754.1 hypothetical protein NECAME_19188 [Necator americanus]